MEILMDNQKTPSERISGTVKFYNRDNDYGFILADNNQEFFFRLSNFAQSVNGVISPYTKVTFVPKPTQNPKKKSYATDILLVAGKVDNSSVTSSDALPPPCPHCGARKGSHFGWNNGYGTKIYLCNVCGKEHTYGDMLKYNSEALKVANKVAKDFCRWEITVVIVLGTILGSLVYYLLYRYIITNVPGVVFQTLF